MPTAQAPMHTTPGAARPSRIGTAPSCHGNNTTDTTGVCEMAMPAGAGHRRPGDAAAAATEAATMEEEAGMARAALCRCVQRRIALPYRIFLNHQG